MALRQAKDLKHTATEACSPENTSKAKKRDMENTYGETRTHTKGISAMTRFQVMVFLSGLMAVGTRDIGTRIRCMV